MRSILYAGAIAISLPGCQVLSDRDNKTAAATIVGAGVGILLASELYGAGTVGTLAMLGFGSLGAAGGYYLAQQLLPHEEQAMNHAAYRSLKSTAVGETVSWQDPDTGNSGTFTPVRAFVDERGQPCRELRTNLSVGK